MKNKIIDFKTASADGVYKGYTLDFNLDNPTITYNGEVYNAIKPGEVLRHENIKNPQPLPKKTYGFIIEDEIFIVSKTHIHGIIIQPLNPRLAITYKGKDTFDNIVKYSIPVIAIIAIIMIILMGWDM